MTPLLLETNAVAKAFGTVVALRAVDLQVRPGEVHALLGANGAGKSTLVKILTGVLRADAGAIKIHGEPVTLRRPSDAQAHGLAPVFQDPAMAPDLTIAENLRLTGVDIGAVRSAAGRDGSRRPRSRRAGARHAAAVPAHARSRPRARVRSAAAAARRDHRRAPPDLSERVFNVMRVWKERNRSVLFISHRLAEVQAHCDMCTILRDGRDVASFVPSEGGESQIVSSMLGDAADGRT